MHDVVTALLARREPVQLESWRALWHDLDAGALDKTDAVALLASLSTALPEQPGLGSLLASLRERQDVPVRVWPGSVNVVGTGGGPKTFNVSTAAAFVAAASGVPVVKSGSRAYTSSLGSIDLIDRLGLRATNGHAQSTEALERFGLAFTGGYVYPAVFARLARTVLPVSLKAFGRFLNILGPFLAGIPVSAQVTGASAGTPQDVLRDLAARTTDRTVWLCTNDVGADELLPFADNEVHTPGGVLQVPRGAYVPGDGSIESLRPVEPAGAVRHFTDVLAGRADAVAVRTVCLNAAALAVAGGHRPGWADAVAAAEEAVHSGAAAALLDRMRPAVAAAVAGHG